MSEDDGGVWMPRLSPKQYEIFNCYGRYVLVSGPRYSAKTWGVLQRLMRHAWETPSARIGVFTNTLKNAKVGVWDLLYQKIVPEWTEQLEGCELVTPMKMDGATRMEHFRISNMHGGDSEFQLHSLKIEDEIAQKVKGTVFSCIFVSELTNFKEDYVFRFPKGQLRMPGVPYDSHMWIADTNPCEEEGQDFWAYKIWYEEAQRDDHPNPEYQKNLTLIETKVADNTFLDPREFEDLKATFAHDPDLYASYVDGKWVETSKDSFFTGVFASRHVGGSNEGNFEDWDVLLPDENTDVLYTGWDLGDKNHAAVIMEKVLTTTGPAFNVLDELVVIDGEVTIEDFTISFQEMMREWEEVAGKRFQWVHWSDASAVDRFRSAAGTWDSMIVSRVTGGEIVLSPCPKFAESVRLRVMLTKQLLTEGRLTCSVRSEGLIESLKGGLKKTKGRSKRTYVRNNKHKHVWDATTYCILGEMFHEIQIGDHSPAAKLLRL